MVREFTITGDHSKWNQILLVKIGKYVGFSVYRRSYLLWFPVIGVCLELILHHAARGWRESESERERERPEVSVPPGIKAPLHV